MRRHTRHRAGSHWLGNDSPGYSVLAVKHVLALLRKKKKKGHRRLHCWLIINGHCLFHLFSSCTVLRFYLFILCVPSSRLQPQRPDRPIVQGQRLQAPYFHAYPFISVCPFHSVPNYYPVPSVSHFLTPRPLLRLKSELNTKGFFPGVYYWSHFSRSSFSPSQHTKPRSAHAGTDTFMWSVMRRELRVPSCERALPEDGASSRHLQLC